MNKLFFSRAIALLFFLAFLISCDKDYNTLGGDIVGGKPFDINGELFDVVAYSHKIQKVQTNNLPINQLGVFNDGNSNNSIVRANFVTQLSLASTSPTFHKFPVVDSVILTIPYYSTKLSTNSNGWSSYRLDSIRSYTKDVNADTLIYQKMDLKVYKNNYQLETYDSNNIENTKKYYSTDDALFDNNKGIQLNNDPRVWENIQFYPHRQEYVKPKVTETTISSTSNTFVLENVDFKNHYENVESRSAPRMRLHLDKATFQTLLNDASNPATSFNFENNDNFKRYFRGLYFKVGNTATSGCLMTLNFAQGNVIIYYKQNRNESDTSSSALKEMASLTLNMSGNTVNTFNNDNFNVNTNSTTGADRIYLKGGQGSLALIDLFNDNSAFSTFKSKNLIVNDAALTLTVDKSVISNAPIRLYLFDLENNKPIIDYSLDGSRSLVDSKYDKYFYGGILFSENGDKKYRFNITNLVRKIYNEARANPSRSFKDLLEKVRLGLVITENINTITVAELKANGVGSVNNSIDDNPLVYSNSITNTGVLSDTDKKRITISKIPMASVINASGIVLYGNNIPVSDPDYNKRLKLEINYTEIK